MSHNLPDATLITPTLLRRARAEGEQEGGDGRHVLVIRKRDGAVLTHKPASPDLDMDQLVYAMELLQFVNREIHHDGAWVVVFTHPVAQTLPLAGAFYARMCGIWLDQDGDPQFTIDWINGESEDELTFHEMVINGVIDRAHAYEAAWQSWHEMMRKVLEPRQDQLYRKALGEQAPSAKH